MNDSNMAANIFGRYVWLIDILYRYKRLTFQEINELWQKSGLGNGEKLPLRTFHSHQSAIRDVFDVYIECDYKDGFRYYIDEKGRLNGNNLRHWLISSYAALNQMRIDNQLEERIIFEDISSGQAWLTCIAEAMRNNHVLSITYQGFGKEGINTFEIEPYFLKSVKHRWYVVAHNPYYLVESEEKDFRPRGVYLIYALDRISIYLYPIYKIQVRHSRWMKISMSIFSLKGVAECLLPEVKLYELLFALLINLQSICVSCHCISLNVN